MSIFLNGRSLSCLVCPKSSVSCLEQKHPLQRLMSYDELIGKYARKINREQHDGISIYTCPYCGIDRLTIDALYEHSRVFHLNPSAGSTNHHPPEVQCPVCVCFRLEDCTSSVMHSEGLVEHMLSRHCFSTTHQYTDEFELRNDFCNDDEFELIRFLATFLPPAIIAARATFKLDELKNAAKTKEVEQHQPSVCPICLEEIEHGGCKDLPPCNHKFHGPCIDRWLAERNCCPICRCDCTGSRWSI